MRRIIPLLCLLVLFSLPAHAVKPDERLADPALEARARVLSAELRCMVCQNENIDDSDADLARDIRLLVRDRLVKGDSDAAVLDFLVARYGQFVLLKPRFEMETMLLWGTPVLVLFLGGLVAVLGWRRQRANTGPAPLDPGEEERLNQLLGGDEG